MTNDFNQISTTLTIHFEAYSSLTCSFKFTETVEGYNERETRAYIFEAETQGTHQRLQDWKVLIHNLHNQSWISLSPFLESFVCRTEI